ncbi:myocardin [Periophthalmus magnuspinnatus]|uniref:myocardin n=1 Tax=Periophthalmus magnuspinnatus TaxID=409849 RepID=UPI00243727DE|nr:myocardin [Periophthalmus magnuspinnatus]XP_055083568.1 myocardin [Periophthalmus magnuspinnatus]
MTLAASERSLLIRNKFRSVLQLRIQNRRQNEINADPGKSTSPPQKTDDEKSEALRLSDDGAAQKLPPSGVNAETAKERSVCGTHRHKKARQAPELVERVPRLSSTTEQQQDHRLPLENRTSCFALPSDVFEDDISSCSSSSSPTEQHGTHRSAAFPSLPLLSGEQLLSDFSAAGTQLHHSPGHTQSGLALLPATEGIRHPLSVTVCEPGSMATSVRPNGLYLPSATMPLLPKAARPPSPTCSSTPPSLNLNQMPRPRKQRDSKPKMKKLKYHQYIPPDQRGTAGTTVAGAKQKSPPSTPALDPAYSHLVKQQQVFLQLQILQNQQQQQQITVVPSGDAGDQVKSSGALPLNPQPVPAATNQPLVDPKPAAKLELLPANLVDLTVSELRQHLRKRGLPVSGTKPALLQRLRPFQLPQPCVPPVPLCQLGISTETLPTSLSPNQSPISSASSGSDSPSQCPSKHIYIHNRKIPNGIVSDAPSGILSDIPNAFTNATSVSLAGEPCTMFLAPASTASGTPSPSLPMSSSSPLQCGTPWRTETEQQQQQREELNVELEMRERMKSRPRDHLNNSSELSRGGALHPFLQQDSGCSTEKPRNEEELFTQLYCCQPCDVIGQDFELPVQITASPVQSSPAVRSLEEELQEAIQKAQMDPRQSLDDILDEPISCNDSVAVCDGKPSSDAAPSHSPLPQSDQLQPKDDSFLPSPLCSSLLLEMPPSPAVIPQSQVIPAPPPPPLCTSPLPLNRKSRKRHAPPPFDAAEWLETLTCGLLTPPTAPFVEPDFSLDSDLNVNRVLDLMIEQW